MRRLLARCAVVGGMGVLATLGVAWGRSLLPLSQLQLYTVTAEVDGWPRTAPSYWGDPIICRNTTYRGARTTVYLGSGALSRLVGTTAMEVRAFGWPFPCVARTLVSDGESRSAYGVVAAGPVVIPVAVLWGGFVTNWLVYSCMAGIVLYGFPSLRSRWRQRLGRCVSCGYDLRSIRGRGCPECGRMLDR